MIDPVVLSRVATPDSIEVCAECGDKCAVGVVSYCAGDSPDRVEREVKRMEERLTSSLKRHTQI